MHCILEMTGQLGDYYSIEYLRIELLPLTADCQELRFLVVFLSPSRKMLRQFLKIRPLPLPPNSFPIHHHHHLAFRKISKC
jgi:hypothetical protein